MCGEPPAAAAATGRGRHPPKADLCAARRLAERLWMHSCESHHRGARIPNEDQMNGHPINGYCAARWRAGVDCEFRLRKISSQCRVAHHTDADQPQAHRQAAPKAWQRQRRPHAVNPELHPGCCAEHGCQQSQIATARCSRRRRLQSSSREGNV